MFEQKLLDFLIKNELIFQKELPQIPVTTLTLNLKTYHVEVDIEKKKRILLKNP